MAKIYASGNYVIVEDGDNLYEYAKGHTLYLLVDDIFYIKEITQGQYKVSVADLDAGDITAEDSGDVYTVATFTTFLRENTGFKTAPGGSGAEWGSIRGTLSTQSDLQSALDSKQDDLVSGTNIKTINGNSVLGGGDLTISGGGGNLLATHILAKPRSGFYYGTSQHANLNVTTTNNNTFIFSAFTPAYDLTISEILFQVTTLFVGGLLKAVIYSDNNGVPHTKLFESATVSTDTTGTKTLTGVSFTFTAGTTYWISMLSNNTTSQVRAIPGVSTVVPTPLIANNASTQFYNSWFISGANFASPITPLPTPTSGSLNGAAIPYLIFRAV